MRILLAFTPFHPPTSAPFGIACLKSAVERGAGGVTVRLADWNLRSFRRWLLEDTGNLCEYCPNHSLGCVCPDVLAGGENGRWIWENLTLIPRTQDEQSRYMQAAVLFDGLYDSLRNCYDSLLRPFVEANKSLSSRIIEQIFGAEMESLETEKPDLVGFSVLGEHNLLYSLALAKVIREQVGIPVAMGGALMSHLDPEEMLRAFEWLDYCFAGEGEESLAEFLRRFPDGDFEGVGGLAHRTEGKICAHAPDGASSLDELPFPDFSDFRLDDYLSAKVVLPIMTSRGCYWAKCGFCSHTRPYAPGVRNRSIESVVDEMEHQKARLVGGNAFGGFLFVDEAIPPRRLEQMSVRLLERGTDVIFGAEGIRPEKGFTLPLLKTAYEAGLRWVYLGVESVTQRLLDLIEKGTRVEDVSQLIENCDQMGVTPHVSYITGLPTQTPQELMQELHFLQSHPADSGPFSLLLDSPIQKDPGRFGVQIEAQEVLFRTPYGKVHAPRFCFTVKEGLSPSAAARMIHEIGPLPRLRPHVGEIHAVLLSCTDFFLSEGRPDDLVGPADFCVNGLSRLEIGESKSLENSWRVLHLAGCYEAQSRIEEALRLLEQTLQRETSDEMRGRFMLHIGACYNQLGQYERALKILRQADLTSEIAPATYGELTKALFSLEQYAEAAESAEKMLESGLEGMGIHFALGLCYEKLGRSKDAIATLKQAEERNPLEAEINFALGRCYKEMGDPKLSAEENGKAQRKRRSE